MKIFQHIPDLYIFRPHVEASLVQEDLKPNPSKTIIKVFFMMDLKQTGQQNIYIDYIHLLKLR